MMQRPAATLAHFDCSASVIKPFVLFKDTDSIGILSDVIKRKAEIPLAMPCWKFHEKYEACISINFFLASTFSPDLFSRR